jgi:release factor glutamine methyltransferase
MTINSYLKEATSQLASAGIGTARLDALILLEDVSGKDRAWLLAHDENELSSHHALKLKNLLKQRVQHIPLAYVRGRTEFYGRTFVITANVLEPRPESETMIDMLKGVVKSTNLKPSELHIADIGTGSGALGITAALELPGAHIELLELDPKALKVAKSNVDLFTLDIPTVQSDLLRHSQQQNDILLCNLPYVPDDFQINRAASHEPRLAIFGGPDGLNIYRELVKQLKMVEKKPLYILTEALPSQHSTLSTIVAEADYILQKTDDFIQLFALQK